MIKQSEHQNQHQAKHISENQKKKMKNNQEEDFIKSKKMYIIKKSCKNLRSCFGNRNNCYVPIKLTINNWKRFNFKNDFSIPTKNKLYYVYLIQDEQPKLTIKDLKENQRCDEKAKAYINTDQKLWSI